MLAMPNSQKTQSIEKTTLEMKGPDLVCKESHGQCHSRCLDRLPGLGDYVRTCRGWEVAVIAGGRRKCRVLTEITKVLKRHRRARGWPKRTI